MKRKNPVPSVPNLGAVAVTQLALSVFRLNGVLLHWGDQLVAPLQGESGEAALGQRHEGGRGRSRSVAA